MKPAMLACKAFYDALTPVQQDYVIRTVIRMKAEILEDMLTGELMFDGEDGHPEIHYWADLNLQTDANSYGGMHDESSRTELHGLDLLGYYFPAGETQILPFMVSDEATAALNWMHDEVDHWLHMGGHTQAYADIHPKNMTPVEYVIFSYALLMGVAA